MEYCIRRAGCSPDCRRWSEQEMVCKFGGAMEAGTPDGMFEDTRGALTCVQVVRAPVLSGMNSEAVRQVVYMTVLGKIWKSIKWMKSARIIPNDFVIFCWVPHLCVQSSTRWCKASVRIARIARHVGVIGVAELDCAVPAKALIRRVSRSGWPFSLELAVAGEPEALFPVRFGYRHLGHKDRASATQLSEADISAFVPEDFESDSESDGECLFDLFAADEDVMYEEEEVGSSSGCGVPAAPNWRKLFFADLEAEREHCGWRTALDGQPKETQRGRMSAAAVAACQRYCGKEAKVSSPRLSRIRPWWGPSGPFQCSL